jgi:hypothetical protein
MKMQTTRNSILCLIVLLLMAPMLRPQDLSKYRAFSLGTSLASVLKQTEQKSAEVKVIHARPALIQELNWWLPKLPGASSRPETVEQILFSFYNGELYKISLIYDQASTEGLTARDMITAISAKYGQATNVVPEVDSAKIGSYDVKQKLVASWEDSQYSFNLVQSYYTERFGLVIYSKRANAEAELAIAEAVKLDKQEGPQREAERQKKEAKDLEVTRQKNLKNFRP